ncbi:GNAT family N-acetyltransferase [Maribacter confluentis]|uniref:GNAT family N-acetyltransferase n=1 Tax=Maribacter confluentis TaxID=1656093 RepID=A0ABT8RQ13_9FLAO|nr:GNAT family N-acetyltransferase [Maribacter confluentis]MDO1513004.1 GNAT family N-acetyltransferase [Maribacter confluentis]
MELNYTLCTLTDLKSLKEISEQTFIAAFEKDNNPQDFKNYISSAFALEKIKEELLDENSFFYFARIKDNIVGYFKLNINSAQTDIKKADYIELERIYVLPQYQGKGLGKKILNFIKRLPLVKHKERLWLGVWENNTKAINFYQNNGFVKFGTHPYLIGSDQQTDWLMGFKLSTLL